MNNKWLKIGVIASILLILVVTTSGCVSTPPIALPGTPALTMTARQVDTSTLFGAQTVKIRAEIQNEHAGTIRLSTSNFLLTDSSDGVHKTISSYSADNVVDNGEGVWFEATFYITAGSHPTELTYFDGTNKMVCPVN